MLAAQAGTELRLALRNGEQVLLTLVIPVLLLVGLTVLDVVPLPEPRSPRSRRRCSRSP